MAKKNRYLGCEGLTPHEISLLHAMLRMMDERAHGHWEYSEAPPYDALVVPDMRKDAPQASNVDDTSSLNLGFSMSALFIRTNIPAATVNGERRSNQNFIVRPIRPSHFVEKLMMIDELLETQDSQLTETPEAEIEWADLLMQHWGQKDNFIVKTANYKAALFMGPKRVMFDSNLTNAEDVFSSPILNVRPIERARAKQLLKTQPSQSICWLAWHAAHLYQKNKLSENIDQSQLYCLKHWPDFGTWAYLPEYITLAGFLTNYDLTEGQLLEASKINEEIVHRFMNACLLSGLLVPVERKGFSAWLSRNQNPLATQRKSLFAKIRARLGI